MATQIMMNKRRHHYVWQTYLDPWTNEEQVWCLRAGGKFLTSTVNIGLERDFYKVTELNKNDVEFIKLLGLNNSNENLKKLGQGWIKSFIKPFHILTQITEFKDKVLNAGVTDIEFETLIKDFSIAIKDADEDLLSKLESDATTYFIKLREMDASFYGNPEDKINFAHFVSVQYLRTKKPKRAFSKECLLFLN